MYTKLKQLILEGITTGGDPYKTGYRVSSMTTFRKRKNYDDRLPGSVLSSLRILNRMYKRNKKKNLPEKDQENMLSQYMQGIERGKQSRNRRN